VRILLFTGPGGAGTTTVAAAAAVRSATGGRRTVLLSRQPPPVPGLDAVPGLALVRIDPQAALERFWGGSLSTLRSVAPQLDLPPAASVAPLPGAGPLAVLAELARAEADLVVVDAGPVHAALELLTMPSDLRWWLDQLLSPRIRALGAMRTAAVAAGAARSGPVDAALAAVPALQQLLSRSGLGDPAEAAVALVTVARRGAAETLREAVTALALHGQRPAAVLARVLPGEAGGQWWAPRLAEQEAALAELAEIAPVGRVPETATGPADAAELAGLLPELEFPPGPPLAPSGPRRVDGGFELAVPLPFADRSRVQLARSGAQLVVTTGGARRALQLDSLLRRCRVVGGRIAEPGTAAARLEITFAPDPQLWPADLLAAEESAS
jgi:arsenite-transporting ATPase